MSLFVSAPDGLRIIGARTLFVSTLAWCLLPVLIGGAGWMIVDLAGGAAASARYQAWQMLFYLLLLSPLVSAPYWIALGIGAALFCRRGYYGSLTALVWGLMVGAASAYTAQAPSLIAMGAIMATFHRFSLAVLRPTAF